MRRAISGLLAALLLTACAARPGSGLGGTGEALYAYEQAVEVNNTADFPVVIRYYARGGGPFYLGEVGARQTRTLVLPRPDVGTIFAETVEGRRLDRRFTNAPNPVRFRRVEVQRST